MGDIKPNAIFEKVSKGLNFEDFSKNKKGRDDDLINEIKFHWILRPDHPTMANYAFFIKH
jgi:hypothetical protein